MGIWVTRTVGETGQDVAPVRFCFCFVEMAGSWSSFTTGAQGSSDVRNHAGSSSLSLPVVGLLASSAPLYCSSIPTTESTLCSTGLFFMFLTVKHYFSITSYIGLYSEFSSFSPLPSSILIPFPCSLKLFFPTILASFTIFLRDPPSLLIILVVPMSMWGSHLLSCRPLNQ